MQATASSETRSTHETKENGIGIPKLPRWVWSLIGGAIGLFDFGVLLLFDANLTVAGNDATVVVGIFFFIPYALLGWAVGGLAEARKRADLDRLTIATQLGELERSHRALVQEEKLAGIGRLAAGVAHEVRNPLGVIRASASMAQESFDPNTDPHRALGFVCEETDRLDRLIASLLTFAKPQPIESVDTDVTKVIDRALELSRHEATLNDVTLETQITAGLPPIKADPDRLAQSLFGLTLNAIQAMADLDDRPRRVGIFAGVSGDLLRIDIRDSGDGIPGAFRDQIFEPFVTTKASGTGLGLPMALRMTEAQGGVLRLDDTGKSESLPGACFTLEFSLPSEELN